MNAIDQAIFEAAADDIARLQERTTRSWRSTPQDDPNEGWEHQTVYRFKDGETVTLNGNNASDVVLPATPGFDLLYFERPEHGDPATHEIASEIHREPVIGWTLHGDREIIIPISTSRFGGCSWNRPRTFLAISFPGGRVEWRFPWNPKIMQLVGGADSRDHAPVPFEGVEGWVAAVRMVWAEQIAERERAAELNKPCPQCGRGGGKRDLDDDDIPF
jgi:hypothetical protein